MGKCVIEVDGFSGLRYARVVIATDADHDGMHIRNLLLTVFLTFFPELVTPGHLFILDTPLYRVRNRREIRYCYSDVERDAAVAALPGSEVTRFKGLGEISPMEFGQFIGPDIRLVRVDPGEPGEAARAMNTYSAENRDVPGRKAFLIEHLITEGP